MSNWNGKVFDNDHSGDAALSIIIDHIAAPVAVITILALMFWVYATGAAWYFYIVAVVVGPILGLFVSAMIGLLAIALFFVLATAVLPFYIGYRCYLGDSGDAHE